VCVCVCVCVCAVHVWCELATTRPITKFTYKLMAIGGENTYFTFFIFHKSVLFVFFPDISKNVKKPLPEV